MSPKKADDNFSSAGRGAGGEARSASATSWPVRPGARRRKDEPSRPVVVAASYKFQTDWTFDPEAFSGKAVVLRLGQQRDAHADPRG